jgi:hypothetical protein
MFKGVNINQIQVNIRQFHLRGNYMRMGTRKRGEIDKKTEERGKF